MNSDLNIVKQEIIDNFNRINTNINTNINTIYGFHFIKDVDSIKKISTNIINITSIIESSDNLEKLNISDDLTKTLYLYAEYFEYLNYRFKNTGTNPVIYESEKGDSVQIPQSLVIELYSLIKTTTRIIININKTLENTRILNSEPLIFARLQNIEQIFSNQSPMRNSFNKKNERTETISSEVLSELSDRINKTELEYFKRIQALSLNTEKNISNKFNQFVSSINDDINKELNNSNFKINDEIIKFENLNKEMMAQAAVRGNETLTMGYSAQANKEERTANILRIIGVIWLTTLSIYSAIIFHNVLKIPENINLSLLLIRWLVIFLLTLPGIYLLKEASRHRNDERKYRRLGVQLATINSYLDGFKDDEKTAIKKDLSKTFFSLDDGHTDYSTVPDLQKSFEKILNALVEIAKKK